MKRLIIILVLLLLTSCSSEILELTEPDGYLNNPIGICTVTDGTDYYLLVTNSNYDLSAEEGSLSVIGLAPQYATPTILPDKMVAIDSFSGSIVYSQAKSLAFISNRNDDAVNIFSVSGIDSDITISAYDTSEITVGENPYSLLLLESGAVSDRLLATNMTDGTVSVITLDDFQKQVIENIEDEDSTDLPLDITGENLVSRGIGANRIALTPSKDLALITSTSSNTVFVINISKNTVEGFIYLDDQKGGAASGSRGITIDSNGIAYVANRNADAIYIIDTTAILKNNISNDVISNTVIGWVSVEGNSPTDVILSPNEDFLYVTLFSNDQLAVIDLSTNTVTEKIEVGDGPTNMTIANGKLYIANFYDSTISVLDTTTNTKETAIANP